MAASSSNAPGGDPHDGAKRVGIDDLNLYAGPLCIEFADIAAARGFGDKALGSVGFQRRSVPPQQEDAVTLAVNAAQPIVEAAGADSFELLIAGTESSMDDGKPISSYIHRHLGLPERCRNFEVKHACYGGTAALQMAAAWARSARGEAKALVVMTDIARRHFGEPSELTSGAGAVAVSVSSEPRLLELDEQSGIASFEVYDVARPTRTTEFGDAVLSLNSYLDLLDSAWSSYREVNGASTDFSQRFSYLLYHTPLISLVRQAHRSMVEEHDLEASSEAAAASFEEMVEPSLAWCREVGNVYGGSLYVALAGLIAHAPVEAGMRLGMFSYGSGAGAEFFSGRLAPQAAELIGEKRIGEALAARKTVSLADYEALIGAMERSMTEAEFQPEDSLGIYSEAYEGSGRLVLEGVRNHHRQYTRA